MPRRVVSQQSWFLVTFDIPGVSANLVGALARTSGQTFPSLSLGSDRLLAHGINDTAVQYQM